MANTLTVGELKEALEGLPADLEVRLSSDTNVDCGGRAVIEGAYRVKYKQGGKVVDYFAIYANEPPFDEKGN